MTLIVYIYIYILSCQKEFENGVCKISAILSWHHGPEKKNDLQYSNWSCVNVVVDDVSESSGMRSLGAQRT